MPRALQKSGSSSGSLVCFCKIDGESNPIHDENHQLWKMIFDERGAPDAGIWRRETERRNRARKRDQSIHSKGDTHGRRQLSKEEFKRANKNECSVMSCSCCVNVIWFGEGVQWAASCMGVNMTKIAMVERSTTAGGERPPFTHSMAAKTKSKFDLKQKFSKTLKVWRDPTNLRTKTKCWQSRRRRLLEEQWMGLRDPVT